MNELERIFNKGPLVIFKWENKKNWPVKYVSENVKDILGYSVEDVLCDHFRYSDIIHPGDLERVAKEVIENSKSDSEFFSHEPYRVITKNKKIIYIDDFTNILRNDNGDIIYYMGYISNVTKIVETKEQNRKLLIAIEQSSIAIVITDSEGNIEYVNPKFSKLTGYQIDELLGENPRILNSEIKPNNYYKELWETIKSGKVWKGELCNRRKNGELYWEYATITPVRNNKGDIVNYIAFKEDITDQRRVVKELEKSEKKYRKLIEESNDAIYLLYKGKFEIINKKFKELFGVTEDEVQDPEFDLMNLVAPKYKDYIRQRDADIKNGKKVENNYEFTILNKDGIELEVEFSVSFIDYKQGIASQGIIRDISRRKQLEQRLVHSQKMEALGKFASGIAHDFNNILSSILGLVELSLLNVKKNFPVTDNLELILNASLRGKELIKNIMMFTRKTKSNNTEMNFAQVIVDVMKLVKPIIPSTVQVKLDIKAKDRMIVGNTVDIYNVLMNLCSNAIHAMQGDKGLLKITLKEVHIKQNNEGNSILDKGKYLKFTVADNGKGMGTKLQKKIFTPFFTTKPKDLGTGMGLATVHAIISRYKGDISVSSIEGKGTSISIFLPISGTFEKHERKKKELLLRGTETILFVDDEITITAVYEEMLTIMGYKVITKNSSLRAYKLFASNPSGFDLVITDMTMPNMTGLKLSEKIKSIRKDIPIILCSGLSDLLKSNNEKNCIVDIILQKPIQINEFLKVIRNILDNNTINS